MLLKVRLDFSCLCTAMKQAYIYLHQGGYVFCQVGHNPGKEPFNFSTGRPDGGAVTTKFTFRAITFEM